MTALNLTDSNIDMDEKTPSNLSYISTGIAVVSLFVTLAYIIFVAGGQANTLERQQTEIQNLQRRGEYSATRDDIKRLEDKIDELIRRELDKNKR
jgi:hypothetical protein